MTPKSLLRHKLAVSTLDELANGEFQHADPGHHVARTPKKVKRVVCLRRQGLLRPARGSAEARARRRRHRARRTAVSVPARRSWPPSSSASPAPTTSSGARKSRRTRARGTRSSTTCAPACSPGRRCTTPVARVRRRRPPATSPTHVAEQAALVADALVNPRATATSVTRIDRDRTEPQSNHRTHSHEPSKSKFRSCPNPFPTRPSRPGTRRPATRSSATRTCVDLETDKVVLEVPSPVDGVLKEIKFEERRHRHQPAGDRDHRGRRRRRCSARSRSAAGRRADGEPQAPPRRPPQLPRRSAAPAAAAGRAAAGRALHRRRRKASIRRRSKAPAAAAR